MAKHKIQLVVRKYNGDTHSSWAVFKKTDLRGHVGIVCFPCEAQPFRGYCDMTRDAANAVKERLLRELK